ncbi:MAG: DUF4249 domain-containing protein [Ignavibacteriaceae bacterium]|nr:DUF4249 domain-containing protein [Ignavibacteriaceae bacterium]
MNCRSINYYFNKRILNLILLSITVISFNCQKVVSIDLNAANPKLVIDANITDQSGPYNIILSKSGDYFEPILTFPPVSNAKVIVSDDLGRIDTFKESSVAGIYKSSTLIGQSKRTYFLNVTAEGNSYSAVSYMPEKVKIDSLFYIKRLGSRFDEAGYDIYVMFKDPPELGNYYRLNVHAGYLVPSDSVDGRRYRLYSDKLTNGNEMEERIRAGRLVVTGDTITVDLLSIDKATYDYFNTLRDILTSEGAATSLAPANPNTNLSNGALGYFAAYTMDRKTIILQ